MRIAIFISLLGSLLGDRYCAAGSDKGEGKKLFRQMEARLAKVKTIQCNFAVILKACRGGSGKGSFLLAPGNKSRLKLVSTGETPGNTVVMVSDGKKCALIVAGLSGRTEDVPRWLNQAFKTGFARAGPMMLRLVPLADEGKDFKPNDAFLVTDFKLGEKGRIGRRQAQLIEYTLVTNGLEARRGKTRFTVNLWMDTKTHLPLKRVVVPKERGLEFVLVETYGELMLEGKIDPKKFQLLDASSQTGRKDK